ncbi:hypothetical protein RRG08_011385 [Elysia crispata]|uniref:Uncharacterized protein n=1 Tax=Elysia crispata TaxID=231223 RepID=A0AAE1DI53_9GAST|nr:hypothetical protein RRG08_011385 [Elysia crispata]
MPNGIIPSVRHLQKVCGNSPATVSITERAPFSVYDGFLPLCALKITNSRNFEAHLFAAPSLSSKPASIVQISAT